MNVEESFALLLTGNLPEESDQVVTRPSGVSTADGPVLLGVDRTSRRHVLIPFEEDRPIRDRMSRGITLSSRELLVDKRLQVFADLTCDVPRLGRVFERLTESLLEGLEGTAAPRSVIAQTLEDWRALLQKALADIPREALLGIVGELEVLRRLAQESSEAVRYWVGPTGAVHDFVRSGHAIEVKATTSVDANRVRISNLDQLDPEPVAALHLAVVHLTESADAPSIDERVAQLIDLAVPAVELEQALGLLGYVRGMSDAVQTRFRTRGVRWWAVSETFPGLRSSNIDSVRLQGVGRVSYDLMLAGAPQPLTEDQVAQLVTNWMQA